MDFFVALLVLLLVAAAYGSRRHPRSNGFLDLFGAGFVPYREDRSWPHGVQEEEPRAWSWQTGAGADPVGALGSAPRTADADADPTDQADVPTIVELTASERPMSGALGDIHVRRSRWPGRD
jgi:hypothetical protein